ncbi:MAG: dTMP kinase [Candidatus Omnitrophica bacterium]|nr:dTMP kinase [Candidatus Omnitrophota bacterium]MBI2495567.1 dTMP kinase [Candidatus Omnitrophota bacterium]MBI3021239.1 dTMP kinase [Candidatus Omnitrophota bacterium]MBI3083967.1 dTMP kinase [Candidatus Omnitrophota bacterium]
MKRKDFFITFEGPEGSGKSSQGRWLVQALRGMGYAVVFLRDPGSTALGRALRQVLLRTSVPLSPLAEAILFIGGRVQLVEQLIRPALAKGSVVVCDRFHDSTVAYQGFGGGLDAAWLDRLGRSAIHGVTPQLTILLDVPTARGFARLHRRRDRMERKTNRFHQRVRSGYLRLATREPRRFVVIDASRSSEEVRREVRQVVMQRLHQRT